MSLIIPVESSWERKDRNFNPLIQTERNLSGYFGRIVLSISFDFFDLSNNDFNISYFYKPLEHSNSYSIIYNSFAILQSGSTIRILSQYTASTIYHVTPSGSFRDGDLYHISINRTYNDIELFINGKKISLILSSTPPTIDFNRFFTTANQRVTRIYINGTNLATSKITQQISDFIVFDKSLVDREVEYIFKNRISPASLHKNIIAHFSFTEVPDSLVSSFNPLLTQNPIGKLRLNSPATTGDNWTFAIWGYFHDMYTATSIGYGLGLYKNNGSDGFLERIFGIIISMTTGKIGLRTLSSNIYSSVDCPLKQIVHLAFVFSGTQAKLYLNGVDIATNTITAVSLIGDELIGLNSDSGASYPFYAAFSDYVVYDSALSAVDIETLYNSGIWAKADTLIANPLYYRKLSPDIVPVGTTTWSENTSTSVYYLPQFSFANALQYNLAKQYDYAKSPITSKVLTYISGNKFLVNGIDQDTFTDGDIITTGTLGGDSSAVYELTTSELTVGKYFIFIVELYYSAATSCYIEYDNLGPSNTQWRSRDFVQRTINNLSRVDYKFIVQNRGTLTRNPRITFRNVESGIGLKFKVVKVGISDSSYEQAPIIFANVDYDSSNIGIPNPSTQSVFRDFYGKTLYQKSALAFNHNLGGINKYCNFASFPETYADAAKTFNSAWTIAFAVYVRDLDPTVTSMIIRDGRSGDNGRSVQLSRGTTAGNKKKWGVFMASRSELGATYRATSNYVLESFTYAYVCIRHIGYQNIEFYVNGVSVGVAINALTAPSTSYYPDGVLRLGAYRANPVTATRGLIGHIFHYGFCNDVALTADQCIAISKGQSLDLMEYLWRSPAYGGTKYDQIAGANTIDLTLNTGTGGYSANEVAGVAYVEPKSQLPPIRKALTFNGTTTYLDVADFNIPGANVENGWLTTVICFKKPVDYFTGYECILSEATSTSSNVMTLREPTGSISRQLNYRGSTVFYDWNNGSGKLTEWNFIISHQRYNIGVTGFRLHNSLNTGRVGGDSNNLVGLQYINTLRIGRDNNFSTRTFNGYMSYFMVASGKLPLKYFYELWNNGQVQHPFRQELKSRLELYIDFQNPFDDAGTLKFPDLSGKNRTIVANGYTDLATLQSNLVDIETLL